VDSGGGEAVETVAMGDRVSPEEECIAGIGLPINSVRVLRSDSVALNTTGDLARSLSRPRWAGLLEAAHETLPEW
jgi:hypothetical protein